MKKWNKIIALISALAMSAVTVLGVSAIKASDYTVCKYGKVADAGADTVKIHGKGYLGTTASQGVNAASAAIYNSQIDPKNVKFTLNFLNDYGKGEGAQSGWYAFNLSATKDWFSSAKPAIAKSKVKGVVVIFKLNPNSKKDVILELSRYTPGAGFTNIFGQSIDTTIKNDWKCEVEIKNGKLKIDGKEIMDLSESLELTVGTGKGYIGFGGFSENHYEVAMNVTMKGATSPVISSKLPNPNTSSKVSSNKVPNGNTAQTSSHHTSPNNTSSSASDISGTASNTLSELSSSTDSSVISEEDTNSVLSEAISSIVSDDSSYSSVTAGNKGNKSNMGLIVGIVAAAVVVIGGGIAGFLIYRKKKEN